MAEDSVRRVVVADADEGIRSLVQLTLGDDSYNVATAHDTESVIRVVAQHRPELVLIDAGLPGAGGMAIASSLMSQPETSHAQVILLFDKADPVDQEAGHEAGVADFLAKPFNAFALLRKVNAIFGD